ncbi:hypothetical protein, partial [Paraburkholderia dinghuensis]|uniref:hypothetical protein n=1 Tax=Paraburkholderia dinghuensis TaxID=2305225 RepID=UPI001C87762A
PTLIGCKFLKIASQTRRPTTHYPAFPASLRQQQRNEIMKNLFRFVNSFFSATAATPSTPASAGFRGGPRCQHA